MGFFDLFDLPHIAPAIARSPSASRPAPLDHPAAQSPNTVAIPLEVVLSIIEAAYYDDDLEPNTVFLRSCALVCRSWSTAAQKLLYSQVTLRSQKAFESFAMAVNRSTKRGRVLADAVVRMKVVLDHNQPFAIHHHSFGLAVTMCPNLYELSLSLYGCAAPGEDIVGAPDIARMQRPAPSFDEHTLSLLKSGPQFLLSKSIIQLLDVWSSLKALHISGTPPRLPSPASEPFPCALEELRLNFQTSPSVDFMKWLLHNSAASLRILELEREPTAHLLEYLADSHGSSLQSLRFPLRISRSCSRSTKVQKPSRSRDRKRFSAGFCFQESAQHVEHVAIGVDADTVLQPVVELAKSGRSALKAVTVHLWNGGDGNPNLSGLKIACAYYGLELKITSDIQVFRKLVRGDPIARQSYPRPKAIDNIYLMRS
ncbi:hypothetical protein BDQ17DRAFT_1397103 [Cyathus striatus]|nr:hypothetical protein BDQ17DRAFT_1397103 [Cyathus striatus]